MRSHMKDLETNLLWLVVSLLDPVSAHALFLLIKTQLALYHGSAGCCLSRFNIYVLHWSSKEWLTRAAIIASRPRLVSYNYNDIHSLQPKTANFDFALDNCCQLLCTLGQAGQQQLPVADKGLRVGGAYSRRSGSLQVTEDNWQCRPVVNLASSKPEVDYSGCLHLVHCCTCMKVYSLPSTCSACKNTFKIPFPMIERMHTKLQWNTS